MVDKTLQLFILIFLKASVYGPDFNIKIYIYSWDTPDMTQAHACFGRGQKVIDTELCSQCNSSLFEPRSSWQYHSCVLNHSMLLQELFCFFHSDDSKDAQHQGLICKKHKSPRLRDITGCKERTRHFLTAAQNKWNPLTHTEKRSFWLQLKQLKAHTFRMKT